MINSDFRKLMAKNLKDYNFFYGNNTGEFGDYDYKVNYQIINTRLEEEQRTYVIDIDVWSKSSIKADTITDSIENLLNYKSMKEWATFILDTRYNADDKEMCRRTLSYEVRTY